MPVCHGPRQRRGGCASERVMTPRLVGRQRPPGRVPGRPPRAERTHGGAPPSCCMYSGLQNSAGGSSTDLYDSPTRFRDKPYHSPRPSLLTDFSRLPSRISARLVSPNSPVARPRHWWRSPPLPPSHLVFSTFSPRDSGLLRVLVGPDAPVARFTLGAVVAPSVVRRPVRRSVRPCPSTLPVDGWPRSRHSPLTHGM